jgi:hypothetical protein
MMDWFDGWMALGGLSIAGLLAVAWFFPPFRKYAIAAAGALAAASYVRQKGLNDGARKKQAEWDKAERGMVDKSTKARADAERTVAAGGVPDDDEFNVDRKVRRP